MAPPAQRHDESRSGPGSRREQTQQRRCEVGEVAGHDHRYRRGRRRQPRRDPDERPAVRLRIGERPQRSRRVDLERRPSRRAHDQQLVDGPVEGVDDPLEEGAPVEDDRALVAAHPARAPAGEHDPGHGRFRGNAFARLGDASGRHNYSSGRKTQRPSRTVRRPIPGKGKWPTITRAPSSSRPARR